MRLRTMAAVAPMLAFPLVFAAPAAAQESVQIQLDALNKSGVSGTATMTAQDNGDLTVTINARGLVPNAPHAQHIHGAANGTDFMCPDQSADKDGDGFVNTEEGLPDYGDIFVSLTTSGDTSKKSGLAVDRMPKADANGTVTYRRTIKAAELPAGTVKFLKDLHIVQHGIDVNDNDKYDLEGLGESTFAKSLGVSGIPEEATNPASCGMVSGAAAGSMPAGGVETGDGSTEPGGQPVLVILGGLAAAAAGVVLRRRPRTDS
ncbi:MAG: hypothetical protein AVDCRST_MAG41-1945 [uncultured Corynebacteriales bacterium]|uniref:CHRD domain-containing protein n=1 Tax=uncultured Mycobacteriales bacterium TaxID=581187 RepID=A0A6J4IK38_9ACTN|nr:MAG: hypothetical protein AVDCRST_MAG41-1945 [uncultured Corynebacteriales bacterium]